MRINKCDGQQQKEVVSYKLNKLNWKKLSYYGKVK
jgi:hypothetical protein